MTDDLTFRVVGTPAPFGSKTALPTARGVRLVDGGSAAARAAHEAWRVAVWAAATQARAGRPPLSGPVHLVVEFVLRRPPSRRDRHPAKRPDLSKLVRGVEDSLTDARVWNDDGQVVRCVASKRWANDVEPAGCIIALTVAQDVPSFGVEALF